MNYPIVVIFHECCISVTKYSSQHSGTQKVSQSGEVKKLATLAVMAIQ